MSSPALPWDFAGKVKEFLKPHIRLLFLGEGEALLPFRHPPKLTTLAGQGPFCPYLAPMGVEAVAYHPEGHMPLPLGDGAFDLAVAWHSPYGLEQIHRVLRPGGFFLTQQVGGGESPKAPPDYNLENQLPKFQAAGFRVMYANQAYPVEGQGEAARQWHRFILIGKKL